MAANHGGLIATVAREHGLDPALVRAVVQVESSGDPWAIRAEPAFYRRYVEPMDKSDTEEWARSISWGLMQVMGQVARELGFTGKYLSALCDPETGLRWGCMHLKRFLDRHGTIERAVAAYNAGSPRMAGGKFVNQGYVDKVMAAAGRNRDGLA